MDMLISTAWAAPAGAASPDMLSGLLPIVLIFVVFYFLLIRPQQKRAKEHRNMVEALTVGDEVVTAGGILGKIVRVDEQWLRIEVAKGTEVSVARGTVSQSVPKGSYKAD
jgi:preprotein translocase subunit YajC